MEFNLASSCKVCSQPKPLILLKVNVFVQNSWRLHPLCELRNGLLLDAAEFSTVCLPDPTEREREIYFKSHISLWKHSSHFRLIGRGVPSVSVVSQLMYRFLCLASPKENPQVPM